MAHLANKCSHFFAAFSKLCLTNHKHSLSSLLSRTRSPPAPRKLPLWDNCSPTDYSFCELTPYLSHRSKFDPLAPISASVDVFPSIDVGSVFSTNFMVDPYSGGDIFSQSDCQIACAPLVRACTLQDICVPAGNGVG